jgi:hypothetical protein
MAMHGEENADEPVKEPKNMHTGVLRQHLGTLKPNVFAGRFG